MFFPTCLSDCFDPVAPLRVHFARLSSPEDLVIFRLFFRSAPADGVQEYTPRLLVLDKGQASAAGEKKSNGSSFHFPDTGNTLHRFYLDVP